MNNLSKQKAAIILTIVLVFSFFVRTYQFTEYLHFKWDQARDAFVVKEALDKGPAHLPLYGPRAVKIAPGQQLRLGPGYYYLQYTTALIFGSSEPQIFAYFELITSLLTILVLYFFAKLYFNRFHSLLIVTLYSFSWIVIQFSRFAWNPNALPLFTLICFYCLLKFYQANTTKKKLSFLVIWSVSLSIAFQLHFMGLFCILCVSILYVLYKNKIWNVKLFIKEINIDLFKKTLVYLIFVIFSLSLFTLPTIVGEIKNGNENIKNFIPAFGQKKKEKTLIENIRRNTREHTRAYFLIGTSFYSKEKRHLAPLIGGFALILIGIGSSIVGIKKTKNNNHRDFLVLLIIWFVTYYLITISIAYKHYLRYFMIVFPLPQIFIVLFLSSLNKYVGGRMIYITLSVCLLLLGYNAKTTLEWFSQLRMIQTNQDFTIPKSPINNRGKDDVTLGQLQRATNYIYENRESNYISYSTDSDYKISLEYLWHLKGDASVIYHFDKTPITNQHFSIVGIKRNKKSIPDEFLEKGDIVHEERIGQLMLYEIRIKSQYEIFEQPPEYLEKKSKSKYHKNWEDVF